MIFKKYFVRIIDSDKTEICTPDILLQIITDFGNYPVRVVPIDSDGNLAHQFEFLVGDDYSLSFLFNDKNI